MAQTAPPDPAARATAQSPSLAGGSRGDRVFKWLLLLSALAVPALLGVLLWELSAAPGLRSSNSASAS